MTNSIVIPSIAMAIQQAGPEAAVTVNVQSLDAQALSINAITNKLRQTIAGVWDLNTTTAQPPQTTTFLAHKNPGEESVLEGGDERVLVEPKFFAPGGKYRSIVKLFIKYENMPTKFAHGTGWLIRPDLMVTAGHNVFDWRYQAGRAIEIKAYAGYSGKASIADPSAQVEFRMAKRCVTTDRWLTTRGSKAYDFAMVQLDQPFTNVTPIKYIETPPMGSLNLGVVGYPADRLDENNEKGARMYEMFLETKYNLEKQIDTMLEYVIDTEGGNSGAPVLRESDLVAIGAHVYGGDKNAASVIGRYGNPYEDYIAAVDVQLPNPGVLNMVPISNNMIDSRHAATAPQSSSLTKLDAPSPLPSTQSGVQPGPTASTPAINTANETAKTANSTVQEGFFDSLADVLKTTSKFAWVAGPMGAPIGVAIGSVASLAIKEAQLQGQGEEGLWDKPALAQYNRGVVDRAILADAALRSWMMKMAKAHAASEEGMFDDIGSALGGIIKAPFAPVGGIPPLVGGPVIPIGHFADILKQINVPLPLADKAVKNINSLVMQGLLMGAKLQPIALAKGESAMDTDSLPKAATGSANKNEEAFMQELIKTVQPNTATEEGWFDDAAYAVGGAVKNVVKETVNTANNVGNAVKGVAQDTINTVADGAKLVGNTTIDITKKVNNTVEDLRNGMNSGMNTAADKVKNSGIPGAQFFGGAVSSFNESNNRLLDTAILVSGIKNISQMPKFEGAFESNDKAAAKPEEGFFDDLEAQVTRISQAFFLRALIADQVLTATMQRPVAELKEEGLWGDIADIFGKAAAVVGPIAPKPIRLMGEFGNFALREADKFNS